MTYIYTGSVEISLPGYGMVAPGQVIETEMVINHPQFAEKVAEPDTKPAKKGAK